VGFDFCREFVSNKVINLLCDEKGFDLPVAYFYKIAANLELIVVNTGF